MPSDRINAVKAQHHLISAHRCRCGWEGDDAVTHIIDALRLRPYYYGNDPTNAYVVLQKGPCRDDSSTALVTCRLPWRP